MTSEESTKLDVLTSSDTKNQPLLMTLRHTLRRRAFEVNVTERGALLSSR